jgi:hypothetical protein
LNADPFTTGIVICVIVVVVVVGGKVVVGGNVVVVVVGGNMKDNDPVIRLNEPLFAMLLARLILNIQLLAYIS